MDWQPLTCRWANVERKNNPDKCIVTQNCLFGWRFSDARSWFVTPRSFRPWRWPCGVPVRGLDRRSSTTFVPDLATEIDSANEALAEESADEITTPALQGQLRAHVNLGHPANGEFCKALMNGRCRRGVIHWVKRHFRCPECEARPMPRARSAAAPPKCYRFNQVCGTRSGYTRETVYASAVERR